MSDSDDPNPYVNPELPPEMASIHNEDLIGGTLFGKHDLFEILLLKNRWKIVYIKETNSSASYLISNL